MAIFRAVQHLNGVVCHLPNCGALLNPQLAPRRVLQGRLKHCSKASVYTEIILSPQNTAVKIHRGMTRAETVEQS